MEDVLEARFEWERVPLTPLATGAVHVGVLDAVAGLPFRVVAIPGLVEGGYPGVLRPDPFLLDAEREALEDLAAAGWTHAPSAAGAGAAAPRARATGQLSLLDTIDTRVVLAHPSGSGRAARRREDASPPPRIASSPPGGPSTAR